MQKVGPRAVRERFGCYGSRWVGSRVRVQDDMDGAAGLLTKDPRREEHGEVAQAFVEIQTVVSPAAAIVVTDKCSSVLHPRIPDAVARHADPQHDGSAG